MKFECSQFFQFRLVGALLLLSFTLIGCGGPNETINGRVSYYNNIGDEVLAEGVSVKLFDEEGIIAIHQETSSLLAENLNKLKDEETREEFLESYFSELFDVIDSVPALNVVETDEEGHFDFSFPRGNCMVTAQVLGGGEKTPRWLKLFSLNASMSVDLDLNGGNQLTMSVDESIISVAQLESQFKRHLEEKKLIAEWKAKARKDMVFISPGSFLMGGRGNDIPEIQDETPHEVTITRGFWIGKFEVTNKQWNDAWDIEDSCSTTASFPKTQVSYGQAQAFCWKLTEIERGSSNLPKQFVYRLPTEAEWEYACRAGSSTEYYFGDDPAGLLNHAYYNRNGNGVNWATGEGYKMNANPLGLYGLYGNVMEWCFDWYGDYPAVSVGNPIGSLKGQERVLRGGSFASGELQCRSASRFQREPTFSDFQVGFRLVLSYPL